MDANDYDSAQGAGGSPTTRVRDVVVGAELARQRARLYSRARLFIAAKYLGDTDPTIDFEAVASVLGELLIAADKEAQLAERLLGQVVRPKTVKGQRKRHTPEAKPARDG